MSTKKKILLIISVFFVGLILIILFTILTSSDISAEALGPSPFKIKAELTFEENQEFHELVKIGESIKGVLDFEKIYDYSTNDLDASISALQKYLEQNEDIIEKAQLNLFKSCNFPRPNDVREPNLFLFSDLLRLINYRATFYILTKNFEKAKFDLIFINEINNELIKKTCNIYFSLNILYSHQMEADNIKLFINQPYFSLEQKLEILTISHVPITSQLFINNLYFDAILLQQCLQDTRADNAKRPNRLIGFPDIPILNHYLYKPNKSIRYYRKLALQTISILENSSFKTISEFEKRVAQNAGYLQLIRANSCGKFMAEISLYTLKNMAAKALKINNSYNQMYVAQQILLYKQKSNQLPPDLDVLNLDKKKLIDLQSGAPFIYYAPNGILYGLGSYKNSYKDELTNQEITNEEILEILKKNHGERNREFVLFLK